MSLAIGTGFEQYRGIYVSPELSLDFDDLTVDGSTIMATDSEVQLSMISQRGIFMNTAADVVTTTAGSVVVGADSAEIDLVSAKRVSAADVIDQIHDTTSIAAGDVMSVTAWTVERVSSQHAVSSAFSRVECASGARTIVPSASHSRCSGVSPN